LNLLGEAGMIAAMTDKKKKPGRPKGRKETIVVQARAEPLMHEALERLAQQNRRTKNTEMLIALENHLRAAGLWPPPQEGADA
jgi:hypothetical protein